MNRDQKAAVVDEIAEQIREAAAIFAVDYRGLSVVQAAQLRARLRESDTKFRIVKNSLSERAADKAGAESLKTLLEGPTALALVHGDAALAAKALSDTARALRIMEFKGGLMDGTALSADDVRSIARLPAREILNAQLVGTIAAPLTGLARGLNALIAGIAIQLQAIADQGLVSGEAPAAAEASADAELETGAADGPAVAEVSAQVESGAAEGVGEREGGAESDAVAELQGAAEPSDPGGGEPPSPQTDEPAQDGPADAEPSDA